MSFQSGTIKDIPGLDEIRELPSFIRVDMMTQLGAVLSPTTDSFTKPGCVQLVNDTVDGLVADYNHIRELESSDMFVPSLGMLYGYFIIISYTTVHSTIYL